eukprot:4324874-Amphidinium_carterae.1
MIGLAGLSVSMQPEALVPTRERPSPHGIITEIHLRKELQELSPTKRCDWQPSFAYCSSYRFQLSFLNSIDSSTTL